MTCQALELEIALAGDGALACGLSLFQVSIHTVSCGEEQY